MPMSLQEAMPPAGLPQTPWKNPAPTPTLLPQPSLGRLALALAKAQAAMSGAVKDSGGTEVKNLGDGLMATFPSVAAGVSCAMATQRRASRHNRRYLKTKRTKMGHLI